MADVVVPTVELFDIADSLVAAAGLWDQASLRLFQNNLTPGPGSVLADFTVATYSGYANKIITAWNGPFLNSDGVPEVDSPLEYFAHNGGGTANNIYGYYVVDTGGTKLLMASRFDAPKQMAANTDAIGVVVRAKFGQAA